MRDAFVRFGALVMKMAHIAPQYVGMENVQSHIRSTGVAAVQEAGNCFEKTEKVASHLV